MGWIASIIMLYGSMLVGDRNRFGFLCQITGNCLWGIVGFTRPEGPDWALIFVSFAFVLLYVRNFTLWTIQERRHARLKAQIVAVNHPQDPPPG